MAFSKSFKITYSWPSRVCAYGNLGDTWGEGRGKGGGGRREKGGKEVGGEERKKERESGEGER